MCACVHMLGQVKRLNLVFNQLDLKKFERKVFTFTFTCQLLD